MSRPGLRAQIAHHIELPQYRAPGCDPSGFPPNRRPRGLDKQQRNLQTPKAPQGWTTCDTKGRALASIGSLADRLSRLERPLRTVAGGGLPES